jgi:VCBS repeat-containing protein
VLVDVLANDSDPDGEALRLTGASAARGTVAVSGGRVAFDPGDAFAFLAAGETAREVVRYTVSDGDAETAGRLVVTVTGVDDAPVARDDGPFYVEAGAVADLDVLGNDVDPDGPILPATLRFSGADPGAVAAAGGLARYRAAPAPVDGVDDSRIDVFEYTVADAQGARSLPAVVEVRVVDPLRAVDVATGAAPSGQTIALSLETEARTLDDASVARARISLGAIDLTPINVAFVIDESSSVTDAEFAAAQAAVQSAIDRLRGEFAGSGAPVRVQIVEFATQAAGAVYDLFDPALDDVRTGTPIALRSGGATNLDAALAETLGFFAGRADERNRMLVVTDIGVGEDTSFVGRLPDLDALNVSRAAVRFFSGALAVLDLLDNTGGARLLASVDDLGDEFGLGAGRNAALVDFVLRVNGVVVADEDDLVPDGAGGFTLDRALDGLSTDDGALNAVEAEARFDTDRDGFADAVRTARTTIAAVDGADLDWG